MAGVSDQVSLSVVVTPSGHLRLVEDPEGAPLLARVRKRIQRAFKRGDGAGLLHLGAVEIHTKLPTSLTFFRTLASEFVTAICARADVETLRERLDLPPPDYETLLVKTFSAPPMLGAEYLSPEVFIALWDDLLVAFRKVIRTYKGSVQSYLQAQNNAWNLVGRVCFHLAENKKNPELPFAFLATFTASLSEQGRPQHLPLGKALKRYTADESKRGQLKTLLEPVQRAANKSELIAEMVRERAIFKPQAWTPEQAYALLQETPLLEECGVVVRLPPGWTHRRSARPKVNIEIEGSEKSLLGGQALLDFSLDVVLDGEILTEEEIAALLEGGRGLYLLKGKWVEVDAEELGKVLSHWEKVQQLADENGLTFVEGMKLLAGANIGDTDDEEESVRAWSEVVAGDWLRAQLKTLREPEMLKFPKRRALFKGKLRPYQELGKAWLWHLYRLGLGGCLADDMGLGKTIQVLALLALMKQHKETAPSLLVVPASLVANWREEMARFTPKLKVLIAHRSVMSKEALKKFSTKSVKKFDAVITTYGMVRRIESFEEIKWAVVVFDEAQALKNPQTKQTRAARKLKARSTLLLTGTPVENRLSELWSLFHVACPGLLGSNRQFGNYIKAIQKNTENPDFAPLRRLLQPYILRRLKSDRSIIQDLPDKTELHAYCFLSKKQASLYGQAVKSLERELEEAEKEVELGGNSLRRRGVVLGYLTRFKQICNHPSQWLGDDTYKPSESGKFSRLQEICEEIASRQEKVIIFTQFKQIIPAIEGFLRGIFKREGLILHGGTPVKRRSSLVASFQREEGPPFFVISLRAGGVGLNLTAASHVIHFDRWWNPAVEDQATDRAYRIGQKKNVLVHKFICQGTIEERIEELIQSKRTLAAQIIGGGNGEESVSLTELSDQELIKLVSLDLNSATAR